MSPPLPEHQKTGIRPASTLPGGLAEKSSFRGSLLGPFKKSWRDPLRAPPLHPAREEDRWPHSCGSPGEQGQESMKLVRLEPGQEPKCQRWHRDCWSWGLHHGVGPICWRISSEPSTFLKRGELLTLAAWKLQQEELSPETRGQ